MFLPVASWHHLSELCRDERRQILLHSVVVTLQLSLILVLILRDQRTVTLQCVTTPVTSYV
jgi:hypothetical protein